MDSLELTRWEALFEAERAEQKTPLGIPGPGRPKGM
jgi:hypothetical protein